MSDPFDLPTQTLTFRCVAEAPLHFRLEREGATVGTTLAGAFGTAFMQVGCARQRGGWPRCLGMTRADFACPEREDCPFPWLFKPYSTIHRRALGRPVRLRAPRLEEDAPVREFALEVTLWGRQAVVAREVVAETIRIMGDNGLNHAGQPVRFHLLDRKDTPPVTLRQEIDRFSGPSWRQALLVFETPLLMQSRTTDEQGNSSRSHAGAGSFRLAALFGNAAYDLMAWHLEEENDGNASNGAARHALCRTERRAAEDAVTTGVHHLENRLFSLDLGQRQSRSNGRQFPMVGLLGHLELTGRIDALVPWLVVLERLGGGQRRGMGFGAVRFWLR
ncbi:MAG: hypothetical protein HQL89_14950 [Magnetococcales bacterium]|nr:hypothetical protein [Magnetococcales bacterium]